MQRSGSECTLINDSGEYRDTAKFFNHCSPQQKSAINIHMLIAKVESQ